MQTRPEYPILLFSRPIMVLPCKFQTITLFCGLSCGFFAATLPWRPAAISLSCTVLNKMLLFRPALISFFSCWLHLLLSHKLSNFKCLSSLGEVLLGLHGLVPTEPIYFRHCKVYLTPLEKIFSFSAILFITCPSSHRVWILTCCSVENCFLGTIQNPLNDFQARKQADEN